VAEIRLTARCNPTEDRAKVAEAITRIFPDADISGEDSLTGIARSLDNFSEILLKNRIRSAARSVLRRSIRGDSLHFIINKQVATVGKVSFSEEQHPLGDIEVVIVSEDIERLIDEIAPLPSKSEPRGTS
jgi:predicted RNA binding protein with dsRBD fold (UPF0201 family)